MPLLFTILCFGVVLSTPMARAYEFALSGISFDLQEVTSNLDVYFSAMRWNRISNEWDVDVTISNKSAVPISGPLVLLVDSFSGTSGSLRPDGVSTNRSFYDFSGQIPNGVLAPALTSVPRTVGIGFLAGQTPHLATRLFAETSTNGVQALAFTRSLNQVGQPIAGVNVSEIGPAGTETNMTDPVFGVATLGRVQGSYTWKFSLDGYLPVWRQASLQSNSVTVVPYPWLTQREAHSFGLSPLLGGTASNETVVVQFSPGSVPQATVAQLTSLSGQTLPIFLPQGWSPLQAFWLETGIEPTQPATASLVPSAAINNSENALLVTFVPGTLSWQVLQLVPGNDTNAVNVLLPGSGAYALVVPDSAPAAPPSVMLGSVLQPSGAAPVDPANLRASGTVTPANSPASLMPELVTAKADLVVSNTAGPLASGTLVRGEVSERDVLSDGTSRVPPLFDTFVVAYQRPGQPRTGVLHAQFAMRPELLFGPDQLNQGVVHMDIFPPGAFTGAVLDINGGLVASDGLRLLAAPGFLGVPQAVELRRLSPTNFSNLGGTNFSVVAAFEVALAALPSGRELFLQVTGVPPNMSFVLARVLTQQGLYGLEPRARLRSDGNGNLSSDEPATGDRLPGLNGAGQYILVEVQPQQGLVEGVARNSTGQPTGGLPVRITGQPWLTFSALDGSFKLLAPAGTGNLALSNPITGDSGNQAITVSTNLAPVIASVALSLSGLQVASVAPADTATNVPQVSSVVITFNRPINPATVLGNAVQLIGASNQPVATTFSLNLANTTATLLPSAPLDPATRFSVLLSTNIADAIGRPLQGQTQFSFTTVALSARDPAAQLIIYEPGATNLATNVVADLPGFVPGTNASLVVVHGTPGCADPGVPVIVVNEGTGETTTVLSRQDGSFTTFVPGQAQDFISATFVSLTGARLYVPVNRQLFDDGSVGLYQQGGALQAKGNGAPVQVVVPPNALPSRTKFKLTSLNVPELQTQLAGVLPTNGTVAGGALNLNIQGPAPTLPLQMRFPVDLSQLNYPTNEAPTNAAAMVAVVHTNQDATVFEVVDQLLFHPQPTGAMRFKATAGKGPRRPRGGGDNEQLAAGFLDTSVGITINALGPVGLAAEIGFNQVLVPLLFGPRPVVIKGKCGSLPIDIAEQVASAQIANQILNLQTGNGFIDIPYSLAQLMGLTQNPLQGPGGVVGQLFQVALFDFQQKEIRLAKPLSGAFVTLQLQGGLLNPVPGRLFPGMVYATSGSDGYFLIVGPAAGAQYLITATHPLFSDVLQEPVNPISANPLSHGDLSLAGAVFKNFFFQIATPEQTEPTISIANAPEQPAAGQTCQLVINASQPTAPPTIGVKVTSLGNTDLLTGQPLKTNAQYSLVNLAKTTVGNSSQWTGTLTVDKPVVASLTVVVQGQNGFQDAVLPYQIAFTGPQPITPVTNIPPPDTNDVHGPLVVETEPVENGFVGENSLITVNFNKPIDAYVTNHLAGIVLALKGGVPPPNPILPIVRLSSDQQTLLLQFPGLQPDQTYSLTLSGQSIRDLAGQSLDQIPSTKPLDSFTMTFRTLPTVSASLPQLINGRGSAIAHNRLYVLDQAPQDNYLSTYDITFPSNPSLLSRTHLFGVPRDLVVIPQFRYVRNVHAPIETNDLVAVVGGDLDAQINQVQGTTVSVRGQYLWVLNMRDPTAPEVLASPIVSYRVASAVTKVQWAPPYLVYQEFGADIQLLGFVNLQELIIGYGSTPVERTAFIYPTNRTAINVGVDTNFDGDYVDPGEHLPIPDAVPPEFYGKHESYVLQHTSQKMLDFSVTDGGGRVGITLKDGLQLDDNNVPTGRSLGPCYRTLVFNFLPLDIANPTNSAFFFGAGAYPRWVSLFDLEISINGTPVILPVALVSLTPDTDKSQELAVIDISLPEAPHLLNKINIPDSLLAGPMQSIRLRSDGRLEVAGAQNLVLLDPSSLAVTNVPSGQLHPAIVDVIPAVGGITRSIGTTDYGVHAIADGARGAVVQSPPLMQFVSFPTNSGLVDPSALSMLSRSAAAQLFAGVHVAAGLAPALVQDQPALGLFSDLTPRINPALHYYVLLTAPGGAGRHLELGLESLNPVGQPLSNLGQGFAPVRAVSDNTQAAIGQMPRPNCGAPIRSLMAYRVSDDTNSPFFNFYLSMPFALITEAVQLDQLAVLRGIGPREILFSGAELRAFIEPDQSGNSVVGPFAARIDSARQVIYPAAEVQAPTVNRSYIVGDNPPPPGASTPMADSFETIQAHSGELRMSDPDMVLPSPRMPIEILRSIGTQDTYEGPFGVGWDFNYNQRLTVLDPLTFPAGLQMPLVVRDKQEDSEVAGSQDLLFHNGEGESYHFRWVSTNMPPEYAPDPLVLSFNYQNLVSDYYLPQHGLFDLLVRFKDGRFERLTPDGARYRYASNGRLEMIIDRFPANHHDLQYDRKGQLVRIDDYSVTAPRYVQFGYFRRQKTDPDFTANLDIDTSNPVFEGKICRLLDYAGRDVIFQYSPDGFLTNRLGVMVNGENGGYAGRAHTFYEYSGCKLTTISATTAGTPMVSTVTAPGNNGKPVAMSSVGNGLNNKYTIPINNSAATVATQNSSVLLGDGSSTQYQFDKWGNTVSTTVSSTNGPPATSTNVPNIDGLPEFIYYPEGNTETRQYDTNNPVLRSRGNLISVTVAPGPRGGQGYTETFHYDPRYNLESGDQINPNGFHVTYTLTSDGRAVQNISYGSAGTKAFSYNANGQTTSATDENGIQQTIGYDASTGFISSRTRGNITYTYNYDSSIASQLGRPSSIAQPLGAATVFKYDNNLQEVSVTRGGLVALTAYDELGRAFYHQEQVGGGKQWTAQLGYDANGFITNIVKSGVEVNGAESSFVYTYTPVYRSRLGAIHFPNGAVQSFDYDARGNVIKMTLGAFTEEYVYDLNNNRIAIKQGGDLVRSLYYDGLDRATNEVRKTGTQDETVAKSYYPDGQPMSYSVNDPQFGRLANQTVDQIDALGRPVQVTSHGTMISPQYQYSYAALSSSVVGPRMTSSTTWDTAGDQTQYVDPNLTLSLHRDRNGRIYQADRQEDGATYSGMFGYDDLDHPTTLSDVLGTKLTFAPRADGKNLKVTDARGNVTTLDYSSLGEPLLQRRQDGMEVDYRHDEQRQVIYRGDPAAGFTYAYDDALRVTNSTLRNGAAMTYGGFDGRNMPTNIAFPGGSETRAYDLQRQLLQRNINYQSTAWEEDYTYDALGRIRTETYVQNAGPKNNASFDFDNAGPLLQALYHEDNTDFKVAYGYYTDAGRKSVTYPSGITVTEVRDAAGRLTGVSDAGGNIISASSWTGNNQPAVVQLGTTMKVLNTYDARGRLTGSRLTRLSDGVVLAHIRYQYDAANNVQVRQFIHRGGKADAFSFDAGERLAQAQIGILVNNANGSGPALYQRTYSYHATGLDYLTAVTPAGSWSNAPPFATNWTAHDNFLLPGIVDGFNRGPADPLGNVAQAQLWARPANANAPQLIAATIQHDGAGHLVKILRADGTSIENQYQAGGLRFSRKLFQGAQLVAYTAYVYDNSSRLLEEYDRTNAQPVLTARYYYASGYAPVAADLRDPSSGQLVRYYYLRDNAQSVIAVADKNGNIIERAWYDSFGQPFLERRDTKAPVVQSILEDTGGALLIGMSEPVLPAWTDPGPGGGIVPITNDLSGTFILQGAITGAVALVTSPIGAKPFSVLRFTPSQVATGSVSLTLRGGALSDEWGNVNTAQLFTFTNAGAPAGTVFYSAQPQTDTSATPLARSDLGSPFLFQGQYFDYDAGLIYLRARFYDPYSGMFFEPDPLGYEDSVNHYAGLGNNPVSHTDPTGLKISKVFVELLRRGGFSESSIQLFREAHARLRVSGLNDIQIAAKINIMSRWVQQYRYENVEFAYKPQKAPNYVRRFLNKFFPTKPERVVPKTENGLVREGNEVFTGDVDGLYLKINNQFATLEQVQQFSKEVNEESLRLGRLWQEHQTQQGRTFDFNEPPVPINHGFYIHILEEQGTISKLKNTWFDADLIKEVAKKVSDPPDKGFSIKLSRGAEGAHLDSIEKLGAEQLQGVIRDYKEDFQARLTRGSERFDDALETRLLNLEVSGRPVEYNLYPHELHGEGLK